MTVKTEIKAVGIRLADHATPFSTQNLAVTSPTNSGCFVGILRSHTKATELLLLLLLFYLYCIVLLYL
jgi:hypothetical protein